MPISRKPNIYDVANRAGVSHQTVSRVINASPNIKAETREKVSVAMRELGYVPSAAARALVTAKSRIIGVLLTETGTNGPASLLHAMQDEARAEGYFAVAISVDHSDSKSVDGGLGQFKKLGIEGLIVIAPQADIVFSIEEAKLTVPVVYLDKLTQGSAITASVDSYQAVRNATRHLLDLGHKKLLHIAGPPSWLEAQVRKDAFVAECQSANVAHSVIEADWSLEKGYELGKELDLATCTAIFAANDHLALGLLKAFEERNIRVPQDMSLVGFDDIPEARYLSPALTTLRPNFAEIGKVAMGLVLGKIAPDSLSTNPNLLPELIVRDSTAKPRKS